jgi:hypothetical protein
MECIVPAKYDLKIWQGNSYNKTFTLDEDGTPVDLTGATITITIYQELAYDIEVFSFTIGDGITVDLPDSFTANKVIDLDLGTYEWECVIVFADTTVKYLWAGSFIVIGQ